MDDVQSRNASTPGSHQGGDSQCTYSDGPGSQVGIQIEIQTEIQIEIKKLIARGEGVILTKRISGSPKTPPSWPNPPLLFGTLEYSFFFVYRQKSQSKLQIAEYFSFISELN